MKLLTNLLLAAAMVLPASAAMAQGTEHIVIVERNGYFPAKLYVSPGDTVTFRNESPNWVRLYSDDPYDNLEGYDADEPCESAVDSDGNEIGVLFEGDKDGFYQSWFSVGSERTFNITSCMETRFYAPEVYNAGGTDWNKRFDLIIFGDAPNGS